MSAYDVGFLPVGADDRLVGMITDRDIAIRAIGQGGGPDTLIAEAMTSDVKYCFEDEDVEDACK
jgi:CBS domain-containing protein